MVIPYPNIGPKQLVLKSYENLKPFKSSGEGHKDYMIWESIKGHIEGKTTAGPFYFLTNNTSDFCRESSKDVWVLHPDLADQIKDVAERPTVFLSVGKFFNAIIKPQLEGVEINEVPHLTVDEIDRITTTYLEEELSGYSAFGFMGVPFSNDVIASVVGSTTVENRELKKIDDEIVIIVTGKVLIEVDGYMDKSAYYLEDPQDTEIYVSHTDWNDHMMAVSSTVDTPFELKLFYSPQTEDVTGHSLTLPEEIQDEFPYK